MPLSPTSKLGYLSFKTTLYVNIFTSAILNETQINNKSTVAYSA